MKLHLLPIALLLSSLATAQVTLTKDDFPAVGDSFHVNTIQLDKASIPWLIFLPNHTNFSYDLSYLSPDGRDMDVIEEPENLSGGDQISGADYGFAYGIGNSFFKTVNNDIEMVGLSPVLDLPLTLAFQFDSNLTFMKAPLTYHSSLHDGTTSNVQIPFLYDIKAQISMNYEVNGYGKLTIPGDTTFDVIRMKRVTHFYALAKQLLTAQTDTILDSMVTWEFYTPGYSSTVLRVDVTLNEVDGDIDTFGLFSFYGDDIIFTGKESPYNTNTFKATVNTAVTNDLNIQATEPVSYRIFDLQGHELLGNAEKQSSHQLNIEHLESGYYLVVLAGSKGKMTKKIFKY